MDFHCLVIWAIAAWTVFSVPISVFLGRFMSAGEEGSK